KGKAQTAGSRSGPVTFARLHPGGGFFVPRRYYRVCNHRFVGAGTHSMTPSSGLFSPFSIATAVAAVATAFIACSAFVDEYKSGIDWPEPKVIDPGPVGGPPSDAIVLFDGKDLSKWEGGDKWEIKDGYAVAREAGITTIDGFGDCQLHVEWATPAEVTGE